MAEENKSRIPDARTSDEISDLRRQAEEMLRKHPMEWDNMLTADVQRMVHELQVHQIELEMQNDELRRVQQELESSREKYFDLYDLAPVGYVTLNEKGLILEANLTAATLLGRERGRLLRQPLSRFVCREDQDVYYLCRRQLVETRTHQMCEMRMVRKDGVPFWVQIDVTMAQNIGDAPVSRMIIIDISGHKRSDEAIEDLNRRLNHHVIKLEVANEALETYSYSISHDLRAPLRHMSGFADLLQKRLKGRLDEKSLQYSALISESAKRMERLINELLSFSRLGHDEIKKREVNLSHLLTEAISQIAEETKGRDIIWKFGELPRVYGEPSMLKLVLVNLISNAVKFTSTRPCAEIEIGCKKAGGEDICFIKDNGVGFNMEYADSLFGVFQRLHTRDEFEGIGIGLANVRRIILLHGGRTWAEGCVDQGATFYFTLPEPVERTT
jgi:PAS domain S-box-containing protein